MRYVLKPKDFRVCFRNKVSFALIPSLPNVLRKRIDYDWSIQRTLGVQNWNACCRCPASERQSGERSLQSAANWCVVNWTQQLEIPVSKAPLCKSQESVSSLGCTNLKVPKTPLEGEEISILGGSLLPRHRSKLGPLHRLGKSFS